MSFLKGICFTFLAAPKHPEIGSHNRSEILEMCRSTSYNEINYG